MNKFLRIFIYLLIFTVLAASTGYFTYRVMIKHMTVEVPDLTGMSLADADRALETRGLYLKISGEDNDLQILTGHVLSQDVAPGNKVQGMGEINVVVSKGPAVKLISDVVGQNVDEALQLFTQKGLDVKVVRVESDTAEKNTVIAQWPTPEEWKGQNITIVASDGPYKVSYYCPSFMGLLKEDALQLARELGLNVELTEANVPETMVASQQPLPGASINKGETLHLQLKGVQYD